MLVEKKDNAARALGISTEQIDTFVSYWGEMLGAFADDTKNDHPNDCSGQLGEIRVGSDRVGSVVILDVLNLVDIMCVVFPQMRFDPQWEMQEVRCDRCYETFTAAIVEADSLPPIMDAFNKDVPVCAFTLSTVYSNFAGVFSALRKIDISNEDVTRAIKDLTGAQVASEPYFGSTWVPTTWGAQYGGLSALRKIRRHLELWKSNGASDEVALMALLVECIIHQGDVESAVWSFITKTLADPDERARFMYELDKFHSIWQRETPEPEISDDRLRRFARAYEFGIDFALMNDIHESAELGRNSVARLG